MKVDPLTLLLLILAAVVAWAREARAAPINCNQLFSYAASEAPLPCAPFTATGFPRVVGGAEIAIYHYSDGWTDEAGQVSLLHLVSEAIDTAVPQFAREARVPPITFVLYDEISDQNFAQADWVLPGSSDACRVRLYFNIPNDLNLARELVAHEIFHCVQRWGIVAVGSEENAGGLLSARWWVEGSATVAAASLYPAGRYDTRHSASYKPSMPLYRQPDPYATSIFFFSTDLPLHGMVEMLRAQPSNSSFRGERTALSQGNAGALFHTFAEKLVDKRIRGGGGKQLDLPEVPPGPAFEVDAELPQLGLSVIPWTINRSRLKFLAGSQKKLIAPPQVADGKLRISVRKVGDTAWTHLDPGQELTADVPCDSADGIEYDVLYTSSADQDDAVSFQIAFEGEAKECPCQGHQRPVDRCLVGDWDLDNAVYKEWMRRTFNLDPMRRIDVNGNFALRFARPRGASQRLSEFETKIYIPTNQGEVSWMETWANGTAGFEAFMTTRNKMCLHQTEVDGTYRITLGGSASEAPMESIAGEGAVEVNYTCAARSLRIWTESADGVGIDWTFTKR